MTLGAHHHRLLRGQYEYFLLEWHQTPPEECERVRFFDEWQAEWCLRDFAQDAFGLHWLRSAAANPGATRTFGPLTTDDLVCQLTTRLAEGGLHLFRARWQKTAGEPIFPEEKREPAPEEPAKESFWLRLKVVDDVTDEPIEGLKLSVTLPDGSKKQATTNSSGLIELSTSTPGRAQVSTTLDGAVLYETLAFVRSSILTAAEWEGKAGVRRRQATASGRFLAHVREHKVADGDTLESIARVHDLTVDQLTKFNWNTTDAEKIQQHLFVKVGCSERDGQGRFILTSRDEPGLLYLPSPLAMEHLSLEERHVWRVKNLPGPAFSTFSA